MCTEREPRVHFFFLLYLFPTFNGISLYFFLLYCVFFPVVFLLSLFWSTVASWRLFSPFSSSLFPHLFASYFPYVIKTQIKNVTDVPEPLFVTPWGVPAKAP